MYEAILKLLKKELNLYRQEEELSKKRLKAFEDKNVNDLKQIISLEKELGIYIEKVESDRIKLVKDNNFGTLKDIIKLIPEEDLKEKLVNIRIELLEIVDRIKQNNYACQKYIEMNNKLLKKIMKELSGDKELGYTNQKQKNMVNHNNLLNKKI